ncbi:hypothetical protein [Photobacterium leiognathi]|uniref:hypothetical protein n=1 Tax=Photobacterium leiognathi TaxID=553611 RepID=UPI002981CEDA|nr:hypothetical protein [Photobacterium leiognathi]
MTKHLFAPLFFMLSTQASALDISGSSQSMFDIGVKKKARFQSEIMDYYYFKDLVNKDNKEFGISVFADSGLRTSFEMFNAAKFQDRIDGINRSFHIYNKLNGDKGVDFAEKMSQVSGITDQLVIGHGDGGDQSIEYFCRSSAESYVLAFGAISNKNTVCDMANKSVLLVANKSDSVRIEYSDGDVVRSAKTAYAPGNFTVTKDAFINSMQCDLQPFSKRDNKVLVEQYNCSRNNDLTIIVYNGGEGFGWTNLPYDMPSLENIQSHVDLSYKIRSIIKNNL